MQLISTDGAGVDNREWQWVPLLREGEDLKYFFQNEELNRICGGKFRWFNVEIVEVFGRVVRISLVRRLKQFYVNLLFADRHSGQVFVEDIRLQQDIVITSSNGYYPSPNDIDRADSNLHTYFKFCRRTVIETAR